MSQFLIDASDGRPFPPEYLLQHIIEMGIAAYNKSHKTKYDNKGTISVRKLENWEIAMYEFTSKLMNKTREVAQDTVNKHTDDHKHEDSPRSYH